MINDMYVFISHSELMPVYVHLNLCFFLMYRDFDMHIVDIYSMSKISYVT